MRSPRTPALVLLGVSLASCTSSRPYLEVAPGLAGGYCATIKGNLDPEALQSHLLFACAEATLASGDRYFRLAGGTTSKNSSISGSPDRTGLGQGSYREGSLCFESSPTATSDSQGYDSIAVVQKASPALQRGLNPKAREALERHTKSQIPGA